MTSPRQAAEYGFVTGALAVFVTLIVGAVFDSPPLAKVPWLIAVAVSAWVVGPTVEWIARSSARRLVADLRAERPSEVTVAVSIDAPTAEFLGGRTAGAAILRTSATGIQLWSEERPSVCFAEIAWASIDEVSYAAMTIVALTTDARELLFQPDSLGVRRLLQRTIWERAWSLAAELETRRVIHTPVV